MKILTITMCALFLSGCAYIGPKDYANYVESSKAISKDNTVAQTACWSAIAEIAKGGDAGTKVGAIALAEKCKNSPTKIEAPKKNWLGF